MTIHWEALLAVFAVSLSSTVAVVGLVTLAMLGLSARAARTGEAIPERPSPFSPVTGTVVAAFGLTAATLVMVLGLWAMVVR